MPEKRDDMLKWIAFAGGVLIVLPFLLIAIALAEEHMLKTSFVSRFYNRLGILEALRWLLHNIAWPR